MSRFRHIHECVIKGLGCTDICVKGVEGCLFFHIIHTSSEEAQPINKWAVFFHNIFPYSLFFFRQETKNEEKSFRWYDDIRVLNCMNKTYSHLWLIAHHHINPHTLTNHPNFFFFAMRQRMVSNAKSNTIKLISCVFHYCARAKLFSSKLPSH